MTAGAKITYTSASGDLDEFHRQFDTGLEAVRAAAGGRHLCWIGGQAVETRGDPLDDRSPIDTGFLLGRFATAGLAEVDRAVAAARAAQPDWARRPWRERVAILKRAAALIRERKYELAALMSLEVGKSRLEAMGDAEESADLIDYYCGQVEETDGFVRPMGRVTPVERNTDVLRPYGVFTCIAPFNFPLALSAGMSAAALVAGNSVLYKPSEETPWTGLRLYETYRDAGLPDGVFNFVVGRREEIGDAIWQHPGVDGIVFTGSKAVGLRIHRGLSERWIKPCLLELGGKNAALVMESADLDAAAEGVMRSTFSLQNQKCSATSRVYVHRAVAAAFAERLREKTAAMRIGDPSERDVYHGPVINGRAVERFEGAVAQARGEGSLLMGGERLRGGLFDRGHFVAPTIGRLPLASTLFREELFVPFLAVGEVESFDQAVGE
nr:aldehyde dehydrogenase family protein [Gemmatimonadales bacterium]